MEYRCAHPNTGLISLTYISEIRIAERNMAREHEDILMRSRIYNLAHNVTGALLCTDKRFVQQLEGEATTVDELLCQIERDKRHVGLFVIDRRTIATRLFPHWSMAYDGHSEFVSRSVDRALMPSHRNFTAAVHQLLRLIAGFARQFDGPREASAGRLASPIPSSAIKHTAPSTSDVRAANTVRYRLQPAN